MIYPKLYDIDNFVWQLSGFMHNNKWFFVNEDEKFIFVRMTTDNNDKNSAITVAETKTMAKVGSSN